MKFYQYWKILTFIILGIFLSLLNGCRSKPAKFYILASPSIVQNELKMNPSNNLYIGIGPITIAQYLDKPQIVTRLSINELKVDEFHRWAEALDENISQVIAQNLLLKVPIRYTAFYPWPLLQRIDYQVSVNIVRFDADAQCVYLIANWRITNGTSTKIYASEITKITQPILTNDYNSIVAVMNEELLQLSNIIATNINHLNRHVSVIPVPSYSKKYTKTTSGNL